MIIDKYSAMVQATAIAMAAPVNFSFRMNSLDDSERLRIDKWLGLRAFSRRRSLASDAVESGKVLANTARLASNRPRRWRGWDRLDIRVGQVSIRGGQYRVGIADGRLPSSAH